MRARAKTIPMDPRRNPAVALGALHLLFCASPVGQQILTLFKIDQLVPFREEQLDTLKTLRARYNQHSTAPQNRVTITSERHSRMLLAGIQKENLDARLRGHDECILDTHLCGTVLRKRAGL